MKKWIATYLLAGGLALAALVGAELGWRSQGYTPGIVDSSALWALQRDKAASYGQRALVFIGASRTLFGIDLPYLRERLPVYRPVMLAVNGHYPLSMLKALAEDDRFSGVVIVDVDSRGLARYNHDMQRDYVNFYRDQWSPAQRWHRELLSGWQSMVVVAKSDFAIVRSLVRRMDGLPLPFYNSTMDADRNSRLDFSPVNPAALAENFAVGLEADLRANPPPPPSQWLQDLAMVPVWIEAIRKRGGDVIFYTPPVSGRQYALAESAYPRAQYWDAFVQSYGIRGLLAEDVPGMADIPLLDESHMDGKSKPAYTRLLVDALLAAGYLHD